jgi:predicted HAD superfamily Cof-like phosphohydrolase
MSELSLDRCVRMVRRFHQRIAAPIAATPQTLNCGPAALIYSERLLSFSKELAHAAGGTKDVLLSRAAMAVEELGEWLAAHASGDVVAAADALGDRLYILVGDSVACGMPLADIFVAVHQSNCTKMPHVTTGTGKAFKSSTYQAPDLAALLADYAAARTAAGDDDPTDAL